MAKRKKKKRVAFTTIFAMFSPVLKATKEVCAVPMHELYILVKDDKFVSSFLDATGLKKKDEDKIAIAKNTAEIVKQLKERQL